MGQLKFEIPRYNLQPAGLKYYSARTVRPHLASPRYQRRRQPVTLRIAAVKCHKEPKARQQTNITSTQHTSRPLNMQASIAAHTMSTVESRQEPFPAPSRQATGEVNGVSTEITAMDFSDKIMITISQGGRLAQWVQVPLSAPSSASVDMGIPGAGLSALPSTHLTPKTLLGGGSEERETLGQLYAGQIASFLSLRNPDEKRTLLLGLGLEKVESGREAFFDIIELVQQVL